MKIHCRRHRRTGTRVHSRPHPEVFLVPPSLDDRHVPSSCRPRPVVTPTPTVIRTHVSTVVSSDGCVVDPHTILLVRDRPLLSVPEDRTHPVVSSQPPYTSPHSVPIRVRPFYDPSPTPTPPTPTPSDVHLVIRSHPRQDDLGRLPVRTRQSRPRDYSTGSFVRPTRRLRRDVLRYQSDLEVLSGRLSSTSLS